MLVIGAFLAFLGMSKLMVMTNETGQVTYAALFSHCAGPRAGPVLDAMLFVYGNGSCVGYFVFLGDFIPSLLALATGHKNYIKECPPWWRTVAILTCAVLLLPLTLQRDVSAFRFVAPISITSLVYMAFVVASKCPSEYSDHAGKPEFGHVGFIEPSLEIFDAFALCIFAFNCHINVVPVAEKMVRPTKTRIVKVSSQVNILQLCFYLLIGVTGYLSFLGGTPQDLLRGYDSKDPWVAGGRVLLSCTMLVAIVLNLNPTVRSGLQIVDYFRGDTTPLLAASPRHDSQGTASFSEAPEQGKMVRVCLTVVCIFCQAGIAIKVPGVADVLGLLGATVATAMMLAIPAYCMGKVMPKTWQSRLQQAVLLLFALISVASVPVKIYRMF
jgi:amino acid permease